MLIANQYDQTPRESHCLLTPLRVDVTAELTQRAGFD